MYVQRTQAQQPIDEVLADARLARRFHPRVPPVTGAESVDPAANGALLLSAGGVAREAHRRRRERV